MKFIDRFMSSFGYEPRRDFTGGRFWGSSDCGSYSTAGVQVTDNGALQLDVVQAALEAIAGPASSLPIMVFKKVSDDEREPAPEHPLAKLLCEPNERQSRQEFFDELTRN